MVMIKVDDKNIKSSTALSYILGSKAPIIIASGKGEIAEKINRIAEKNGIKIIENPSLANILAEGQIGMCIPPETYNAVAAIFAFLKRSTRGDL